MKAEELKRIIKELNLTYKELGERIGAVEGTVKNWMQKDDIPLWAEKSIGYMVELDNCNKKLEKLIEFKNLLNDI